MIKSLTTQIASVIRSRRGRRNIRVLTRFLLVLAGMITAYSVGFHILMDWEGQQYTWITGFYWTLTVMSTLGFGDITFHTDLGRLFSILVLLSGMVFLLVLFPFTFIEFFYEPWMNAQAAARAPRRLPAETHGHVLLTNHDAVTSALIRRLEQYQYPYALVIPEVEDALRLHDLGLNVVVGNLDDPDTWTSVRAEKAALLATTASDATNTNVAFTVRGLAKDLPIITSASDEASVDILKLAGSNFVLRLEEMIGQSLARRTSGGDAVSHVIGRFAHMGVDVHNFVSALNCVMAQRLVRLVCPHCKQLAPAEPELLEASGLDAQQYARQKWAEGKGCNHCHQTGYHGRAAITEFLDLSPRIRQLIVDRAPAAALQAAAVEEGMITLRQSAVAKAVAGETTLREINRVTFVD